MSKAITLWMLSLMLSPLLGQRPADSTCLPAMAYEPTLVQDPAGRVTFQCGRATPLDVIRAVGYQTRLPIGVIMGKDFDALSRTARAYNFNRTQARSVVLDALDGTGYSIKQEGHVMVIVAGDLTPAQSALLGLKYSGLASISEATMAYYANMLETRIILAAMDPKPKGFGASISTSPNEEHFPLNLPQTATVEEIANRIVSQGPKGIWVWKVGATQPTGQPTDEMQIQSYQHYSNQPITAALSVLK